MLPATAAGLYQRDLTLLSNQALRLVLRSWRRIDQTAISRTWAASLADAVAAVTAGQLVAAEFADPYLAAVLDDPTRVAHPVAPGGYAGTTQTGGPLSTLLYLPVIDAKTSIAAGVAPRQALRDAEMLLGRYVKTLVPDAGRLSVSAGMGARPHVTGYYRMLQLPSCSRCAILAGKHYRYNQGFDRHPKCDCVHIPCQEADDSLLFDARKAIEAGQVTGLSKAETKAIVEHGADPSQVVNIHRKGSLYTAGGAKYAHEGTTRHGVAGARLLAKDIARALGQDVSQMTFRNFTIDRYAVAGYADLFRKGKTYTRLTKTGRVQTYAYQFSRGRRLTPEQILSDAPTREAAVRLLINNGYIL